MSKPGYKSVSLPDEVIDALIAIGIAELEPKGVDPAAPKVIKMLIKEHQDRMAVNHD